MTFIKLAWRNIWRNKRRTALGIIVIALSMATLHFFMSTNNGLYEQLVKSSVTTYNGYIQINRKGYFGNESPDAFLEKSSKIIQAIGECPHVKNVTTRIVGGGLISHEDNSAGTQVIGIEPEKEKKVTIFWRGITQGNFLTEEDQKIESSPPVLISEAMATKLEAQLGDEVTIMLQSTSGSLNVKIFKIKGLFDCGSPEFNDMILITSKAANSLVEYGEDSVTQVVVNLDFNENLAVTVQQIKGQIKNFKAFYRDIKPQQENSFDMLEEFGDTYAETKKGIELEKDFEVLSWHDTLPGVVQYIKLQEAMTGLVLFVIFMAVFLVIFNIATMSVMERKREFGVLKAMGVGSFPMTRIIFYECFILSGVALLIGAFIGVSASLYFYFSPLPLASFATVFRVGLLQPELKAIIDLKSLADPISLIIFTALLVPIFPAWQVAKLSAVESMQSV